MGGNSLSSESSLLLSLLLQISVRATRLEIAVYKVALPAELLLSKPHNYKLILPSEMASRFIAYVSKPTKEKHGSKPLGKSGNSRQIERNPMPIGVSAIDSDFAS